MNVKNELGQRIAKQREVKGMSIRELSRRADVAPNTVINTEEGTHKIGGLNLYRLARALDIDPTELFEIAGYDSKIRTEILRSALNLDGLELRHLDLIQAYIDGLKAQQAKN